MKPIFPVLVLLSIIPGLGCKKNTTEAKIKALQEDVLTGQRFALKPGEIVLTFDDGPSKFTLGLAKYLENKKIPAIYFMNYHNPDPRQYTIFLDNPDGQNTVREICKMSTQIVANHGDRHNFHSRPPSDVAQTTLALTSLCPRPFYFVRFPGGNWNSGEKDALNNTVIPNFGIPNVRYGEILVGPVNWDITGEDWSDGCQKNLANCRNDYFNKAVGSNSPGCKGGIVLLHDIYPTTMELVLGSSWKQNLENSQSPLSQDGLISRLQQRGCKFADLEDASTITALLGRQAAPLQGTATSRRNSPGEISLQAGFSNQVPANKKCTIPAGMSFAFNQVQPQGAQLSARITEWPGRLNCPSGFENGARVFFYPSLLVVNPTY